MTLRWTVLLGATLLTITLLAGCMSAEAPIKVGELVNENESLPLAGVEHLDLSINLGIGALEVSGGSEGAYDAEFRYNVADWKPIIETEEHEGRTEVTIRQPETKIGRIGNDVDNTWTIRLSDAVPTTLDLDIGVGETTVDLANADVVDLVIDAGVGEVELSLRSIASDGVSVTIDGGVGEITVHVPEDVGVRVEGDTGIGEFRVEGLRSSGDYLVNEAYEKDGPKIDITIDAGVGSIVVDTKEPGTARA